MLRRSRASAMEGGALVPPTLVAVETGHQDMLRQSHIKVDSDYFAIDPSLDFESSTILCEDRMYSSDQIPNPLIPITFTVQPQFNVFRSLSESRFVFTVQAAFADPNSSVVLIPKPYWSQLFVRDFTININNVSCNDQHSRTASYAGFVKILLTEGNLKTMAMSVTYTANPAYASGILTTLGGDDTRAIQEGIVNLDVNYGEDWFLSYNNIVMSCVTGSPALYAFGQNSLYQGATNVMNTPIIALTNVSIELTYRPQDGIFIQPKLLPPGVNLNYVFNTSTIGTWCNGFQLYQLFFNNNFSANPDTAGITYTILKAQYYERQYTCTQTALKAYQSLIMRQPLYFSCMTSNTLLYPVAPTQTSLQLTNVFAGRLPNIIVVALLNQSPIANISGNPGASGNIYPFLTYSPTPTVERTYDNQATPIDIDCITSCQLTVNGRTYPHLWTSNMQSRSTQDVSQWYEQYRQCALITKLNGRTDGQMNTNFDVKYKYDNPILTKAEFSTCATFLCFNIRRNGTLLNASGDKEVGGIDLLVNIYSSNIGSPNHPSAQLMVVGLSTDSLATITDGGSTTSFVY